MFVFYMFVCLFHFVAFIGLKRGLSGHIHTYSLSVVNYMTFNSLGEHYSEVTFINVLFGATSK